MERQKRRGLFSRLLGVLFVFAVGVGVGYYLGERGKADAVRDAIRRTEAELQSRARSAAQRGGAALQSLEGGAAAAAESTKAAVRSLGGDTASRP
ncbi:MAG: hypothetical protein ACREKI_01875 [Gemmatimonadota bacterium]